MDYKNMSEILQDRKKGNAELKHFTVNRNDLYACMAGITEGEYVKLFINGKLVMSNTPMEKRTNYNNFLRYANGNVLIGGLGIGLIVLPLLENPRVKNIVIIEKEQDVIDIVANQLNLPDNVKVICADVFDWKPERGRKFDTIYLDIWPVINRDIYEKEMVPLKRKYYRYLVPKKENPDRYISCWAEYQARYDKHLY